MDIEEVLLYMVAILLVTIWLHVSIWLLTRDDNRELDYFLRLLVVAFITVFIVPVLEGVGSAMGAPGIGPIIAFVVLVYAILYLVVPNVTSGRDDIEISIWISFLTLLFIFMFNAATAHFFAMKLVVNF